MNKQQSLDFIKQINSLVPDIVIRNRVVACAVAAALSKTQDIPSAPVQDPSAYYITNIQPRLRTQLSDFNEGVVYDIRYAVEVVRSLWLVRYHACHGSVVSMFKPENSFVENFTGASMVVPPDIASVLNTNQATIGLLGATISNYFKENQAGLTTAVNV